MEKVNYKNAQVCVFLSMSLFSNLLSEKQELDVRKVKKNVKVKFSLCFN
jgi:hypothetical protein